MINVVVPSYNCMEWLPRCLDSLASQTADFRAVIVDDGSDDWRQGDFILDWAREHGHEAALEDRNLGAVCSIATGIEFLAPEPDDIIFILDGDDWLPHDGVLGIIQAAYEDNSDVWLTYGSYEPYPPDAKCPPAAEYPFEIDEAGAYRSWSSLFNHPLTFKKFLWDALDDSDLQYDDGRWFHYLYDHVLMYPMLEMAAFNYICLPNHLYVYNSTNSSGGLGTDADETGRVLLSRPKKPRMRREGNILVPA